MSAFEEIERGSGLGPEGLALLYDLMAQEARRIPVLGPVTRERLDDLVQSFFEDRGLALTAKVVAAGVGDDEALARYVRQSVKHWPERVKGMRPVGVRRPVVRVRVSRRVC